MILFRTIMSAQLYEEVESVKISAFVIRSYVYQLQNSDSKGLKPILIASVRFMSMNPSCLNILYPT
jgi:hypothetical protein